MTILERDKPAVFETRSEPISVKFIIGETIARWVKLWISIYATVVQLAPIWGLRDIVTLNDA